MWSLKSLVMLGCQGRISLHAVQYKWRLGSVLMICSYYLRMPSLDLLFLCSMGQQAWLCSLLVLVFFFLKSRLLFLWKCSYIKKECVMLYQLTKFQYQTLLTSRNIKYFVFVSSYLDMWWRRYLKVYTLYKL